MQKPERKQEPIANPLRTLDHVAILVRDTDDALALYQDRLRLPVLFSEVLDDQHVRLTHLDLGACHLQLLEPLAGHPQRDALLEGGERLHHLCFLVDDLALATAALPARGLSPRDSLPRSGPRGRRAVFLDPATTRNVLLELTAEGTGVADLAGDAG